MTLQCQSPSVSPWNEMRAHVTSTLNFTNTILSTGSLISDPNYTRSIRWKFSCRSKAKIFRHDRSTRFSLFPNGSLSEKDSNVASTIFGNKKKICSPRESDERKYWNEKSVGNLRRSTRPIWQSFNNPPYSLSASFQLLLDSWETMNESDVKS